MSDSREPVHAGRIGQEDPEAPPAVGEDAPLAARVARILAVASAVLAFVMAAAAAAWIASALAQTWGSCFAGLGLLAAAVLGPVALYLGLIGVGLLLASSGLRRRSARSRRVLAWLSAGHAGVALLPCRWAFTATVPHGSFDPLNSTVLGLSVAWAVLSGLCCVSATRSAVKEYCAGGRTDGASGVPTEQA